MGLDINGTRFLLYARKLNVEFTRTAMIGRQSLHIDRRNLKQAFHAFGHAVDDAQVEAIYTRSNGYADQLLTHLGASEVHSFDISSYEGPTHLHDMNREVPLAVRGQYTTVLDGGSLEHVFNFPMAIKNCMEMVSVGGHYIGITPANNFMGHGFYQFSPELYCSIFTRENGFELISLVAIEDTPRAAWYAVRSPGDVRDRVTVVNCMPLYLLVVAKRVENVAMFMTTPQQSDYVSAWRQHDAAGDGAPPLTPASPRRASAPDLMRRCVPASLKRLLKQVIRHASSGFDPRFYRPFDPTASEWSANNPHPRSS